MSRTTVSVRKLSFAVATLLVSGVGVLMQTNVASASLPAFPGAEGGGGGAVGGRGGQVILVTNLNDSGTGSLRACISASGRRTCVFRVSGMITSLSRLQVFNPYLTIAGQTAPGGPVTLGGPNQQGEQLFISTHDVVIRYLSCDGNNPNTPTGPSTGTVCFEEASGDIYNVMWDHVSTRWAGNKMFISYANDTSGAQHIKNVSAQWSLFYEPNINHPVGPGLDAAAYPAEDINQDFHHDVWINIGHRIPLTSVNQWHFVSNIIYNWDYFATGQPGTAADYIDNKYVAGNLNVGNSNPHPLQVTLGNNAVGSGSNCTAFCDDPGTPSVYMSGNVGPQGTDYQLSAEEAGTDPEGYPEVASPIRTSWRRSTPLPAEQFPITADAPSALDGLLTPTVGNSQHLDCSGNWVNNRDSQDARVVNQYIARGSGGEFVGPNYNGPLTTPPIPAGTACAMSAGDGIPDAWKTRYSLSSATVGANGANVSPTGYTYLEDYLDGLNPVSSVAPPPPPPASCPGGVQCDGTPVTGVIGQNVCGTDLKTWSCTTSGWQSTGVGCTCGVQPPPPPSPTPTPSPTPSPSPSPSPITINGIVTVVAGGANQALCQGGIASIVPAGSVGITVSGPTTMNGTICWNVAFNGSASGYNGWTPASGLVAGSGTTPPAITSFLTSHATSGIPYSYQITATNNPASYGASNLPAGLAVNTTNGLISGTTSALGSYNIGLSATNSGGTGTANLSLTVTSLPDTTPPSTPTNLTATAISTSQVNLAWSASTDTGGSGLAGYKIYRGGTQIATTAGTSYSNTGLTASTNYSYTVSAYDAAGNNSAQSGSVSATTQAVAPTTCPGGVQCDGTPITGVIGQNVCGTDLKTWSCTTSGWQSTGVGCTCGGSTPYTGTPAPIPGTIQFENYDKGGEGVAYHDTNAANNGGQYRTTEGVDIETTTDTGGGYDVGWTYAGEWVNYTVNVQTAGTYTMTTRVASNGTGGTFHLTLDGTTLAGSTMTIPNTGGWQTWTTLTTSITLPQGTHILRIVEDTVGASTNIGNFNWISFASTAPSTKFVIGDRVQTTSNLNVRATPSTSGTLLGTQATGTLGVVIGGPTNANGYNWWNINYDTGADGWSIENYLVKSTAPLPDTTPPSTPTNLTASAVSTSQINLTWTASTDTGGSGLAGYKVFRGGVQIATTAGTSYQNTGLTASTNYSYTVSAYDAAGNNSAQSGSVGATTSGTTGGLSISNAQVISITTSGATITWNTNLSTDSQVGYKVTGAANYTWTPCCAPAGVTSHSVTLSGLITKTVYHFIVESLSGSTLLDSADQTFTTL
jgi:chitodextrinase